MTRQTSHIGQRLQGRVWRFGPATFDERSWTLAVSGRDVRLETKPLELLHELLLARGEVVRKDDLLDRIWPGVTVVEASLTTAVHKLRAALGDEGRDPPLLVTVQRIGYRLGAPVVVEVDGATASSSGDAPQPTAPRRRGWIAASVLLAGVAAASIFRFEGDLAGTGQAARPLTQAEIRNALHRLDIAVIEGSLARGWDPNVPFDREGNGALNILFNQCEWDPAHDRKKMLLVARALVDGGASVHRRNVWGDTPYSIAKAERYCGPRHPVTIMLRRICYTGYRPPGDRCEASYELARRARAAPAPN